MNSLEKYEKAERKRLVAAIKSIMTAASSEAEGTQMGTNRDEYTSHGIDTSRNGPQSTINSQFSSRKNRRNLSLTMSNKV